MNCLYFPAALHLNTLILPAARRPLQASLQREDTASPQELPADGSSTLTLEICCPHGIHFACDDFSVFLI